MNKELASRYLKEGQALLHLFYTMPINDRNLSSPDYGANEILYSVSDYGYTQLALAKQYAANSDVQGVWETLRPLANAYRLLMHVSMSDTSKSDGSLVRKAQEKYWLLEAVASEWETKIHRADPLQQDYFTKLEAALNDYRPWDGFITACTEEYKQTYSTQKSLFYLKKPKGYPDFSRQADYVRLRRSLASVLSPYFPLLLPEMDAALHLLHNKDTFIGRNRQDLKCLNRITEIGTDFIHSIGGLCPTPLADDESQPVRTHRLLPWLMKQDEAAYQFRKEHADLADYGPHNPQWGERLCHALLQAETCLQRPYSVPDLLDRVEKYTPATMHGALAIAATLGVSHSAMDIERLGDFLSRLVEQEWHTLSADAETDSLLLGVPFIPMFDPVMHETLAPSYITRFYHENLDRPEVALYREMSPREKTEDKLGAIKYLQEAWGLALYDEEYQFDISRGNLKQALQQKTDALLNYLSGKHKYALTHAIALSLSELRAPFSPPPPYRPLLESSRILSSQMRPTQTARARNEYGSSEPLRFYHTGKNKEQIWAARLLFFSTNEILSQLYEPPFSSWRGRLYNYKEECVPSDMLPLIQWCGLADEKTELGAGFCSVQSLFGHNAEVFPSLVHRGHLPATAPYLSNTEKGGANIPWTNNGSNSPWTPDVRTLPSPIDQNKKNWPLAILPERIEDFIRIMWRHTLAKNLFLITSPKLVEVSNFQGDEHRIEVRLASRADIPVWNASLTRSDYRFQSNKADELSKGGEIEPLYKEWVDALQKVHSKLLDLAKSFNLKNLENDLTEMEWLNAYAPEEVVSKVFAYIEDTPVVENDMGENNAIYAWLSINPLQANPNQGVNRQVFAPNSLNVFLAGSDVLLLQQYDEQYHAVLEHRTQMNREGKMPSLAGLYAFDRISQEFAIQIRAQVETALQQDSELEEEAFSLGSISF